MHTCVPSVSGSVRTVGGDRPTNTCTATEEGCDRTGKEVQGKSSDETKIGGEKRQEAERGKKYSADVIEVIKMNATTYVETP